MKVLLTTILLVLIVGLSDGKRSIWWKRNTAGGSGSTTAFQNQVLSCLSEIKTAVKELQKDMITANKKLSKLIEFSSPYIPFENHTYTIIKEASSWEDAEKACESLGYGATLMNINTVEEWNFILSKLPVDETTYWVGATDSETEDIWKWMDGTNLEKDLGDAAWFGGWPGDNYYSRQPNGGSSQNCVQIRSTFSMTNGLLQDAGANFLNDYFCSGDPTSYRICEMPVPVEYFYDY